MTKDREGEEARVQNLHAQQRRVINNAYAALLAQQNIDTFQAFTFEEAVDAQIERIEGEGTKLRPNLIDRTKGIRDRIVKASEELKKVPPDQFLDKDEERDVNT